MAEGLADKRPCPECGGYLEWSARKQALACPYCGTVMGAPRRHQPDTGPAARDTAGHVHEPDGSVASGPALDGSFQGEFVAGVPGHAADDRALAREAETLFGPKADIDHHALQEQDLEAALRDPANLRNWGAERFELKCQSCQAISVFVNAQVADRCSFCGSPAIVSHEAMRDAITPQSVLPFKYDDTQVRDILRAWYGKRWFAPSRLKKAAATDTLKGIYLPYWTFDARAFSRWSAEAGHYYYTTEQVRGTDGRLETRQVQHVRWIPAAGEFEHFFDDELVPGTVGIHPRLLRRIEPFPTTTDLKPYSPDYVVSPEQLRNPPIILPLNGLLSSGLKPEPTGLALRSTAYNVISARSGSISRTKARIDSKMKAQKRRSRRCSRRSSSRMLCPAPHSTA